MCKKSLLLHACCGPCSTSVLERLCSEYAVTVYYYNPNMDTSEEYERRLEALKQVMSHHPDASLIVGEYEPEIYEAAVSGLEDEPEGGARCEVCFRIRMGKTKELAEALGCDLWTTTLSVSPHKNAALLNEIGRELDPEHYLEANFKKQDGYLRSIRLSKEYDLYRQRYCGCKYAKEEEK